MGFFSKFFKNQFLFIEQNIGNTPFAKHFDMDKLFTYIKRCVKISYASIFNGLDVRVINNGFKKTKIEKFQSEETLEIEISREEQLMNIIERMDKFRCDDSDDE